MRKIKDRIFKYIMDNLDEVYPAIAAVILLYLILQIALWIIISKKIQSGLAFLI